MLDEHGVAIARYDQRWGLHAGERLLLAPRLPAYFRVELSCAKLLAVALLLAPVPARLKEWAYAGLAIDIGSALIAHLSVGDGAEAWGWAAATGLLWGLCYSSGAACRPRDPSGNERWRQGPTKEARVTGPRP